VHIIAAICRCAEEPRSRSGPEARTGDVMLYQPADWTDITGGGGGGGGGGGDSYDVSTDVNSTARLNSINRRHNSSTSVTSSAALQRRCCCSWNRLVVVAILLLLILSVL